MVKVGIWGSLKTHTGGLDFIEVEAVDLRSLLQAVGEKYPAMQPVLERGASVSIDGRIYTEHWFEPIKPESEVYLLPRIVGG
jgi:sulfur-carrier protein